MHIVPEPFRILGNPVNLFESLNCALHNSSIYRVAGGGSPINGCNGAVSSVYAMWFKKIAGGQGVHQFKQPYKGKVSRCDRRIPKWNSGAKVTDVIYAGGRSCDRDYLKKVIAENGHAVIGVYGENRSFKDFKGGILETCWCVSTSLYNCFAVCKLINITTILFKQQLWHRPFSFGCWIWN